MQIGLVVLIVLNLSLLGVNVLLSGTARDNIPLSEPGIPSLPELRIDAPPVAYSSALRLAASSCYTIGPYTSRRAAELVMAKIRNYGLAVTLRSLQTMETLNYLVYIPPLPNRTEAENVIKDMQRFDVQEHMVIDDGPYKNAISLGFFADLNKAMRHAEYPLSGV
ncbi:MAG: SPOR domain-containing protein [Thiolinea sp.]